MDDPTLLSRAHRTTSCSCAKRQGAIHLSVRRLQEHEVVKWIAQRPSRSPSPANTQMSLSNNGLRTHRRLPQANAKSPITSRRWDQTGEQANFFGWRENQRIAHRERTYWTADRFRIVGYDRSRGLSVPRPARYVSPD